MHSLYAASFRQRPDSLLPFKGRLGVGMVFRHVTGKRVEALSQIARKTIPTLPSP